MKVQARGSSLIEVLVALVIVAVTMLGLLGVQLRTMSMQKDSIDRRSAAALATFAAERITANYAAFQAGAYGRDVALLYQPPPAQSSTPALPAVAADWDALVTRVSTLLPGGIAYVSTAAGGRFATVVIGWQDPRRAEVETGTDPACGVVIGAAISASTRCFALLVHP